MASAIKMVDQLHVASPCKASWDDMQGTDRVRFCSLCSLNVFNVSAMSREEAERLVRAAEGRLCVRFFRRADGTVLTRDCPKGIRAVRARIAKVAAAIVAVVMALVGSGCGRTERPTMGDVAVPPPPGANDVDLPATSVGVIAVDPLRPTMGETRPESR